MKTCPICNRTYADDTYSFCLEDGTLLASSNESQTTVVIPKSFDKLPPTVFMPAEPAPTEQFQPESSQSGAVRELLNHLKDDNQKFSTLGRFRYNNEYIWTNGHFFEIAESIPAVLIDVFPLKEASGPIELVKSLQNQLADTYTKIQGIVPSKKEGMTDIISANHTVHVNNLYYQYLHTRYPTAAVMLGASPYNPALFVLDDKLRAGIMGVKI